MSEELFEQMLARTMRPMPPRVAAAQKLYFDLLKEVERVADPHGITAQQALVLAHIGDEELPAKDIIRKGYYFGQNISYNLGILEDAGFLNRIGHQYDRRKVMVSLTLKGMRVAEGVRKALGDANE